MSRDSLLLDPRHPIDLHVPHRRFVVVVADTAVIGEEGVRGPGRDVDAAQQRTRACLSTMSPAVINEASTVRAEPGARGASHGTSKTQLERDAAPQPQGTVDER